jgi:hypothetical protein
MRVPIEVSVSLMYGDAITDSRTRSILEGGLEVRV